MSKQSNLVNTSQDITVDSSGRVGIGTSSPSTSLSLGGPTSTSFGLSLTPSGWNNAKHRLTVPSDGGESVWSWNYDGSAIDSSLYPTGKITVGRYGLQFATGGTNAAPTERMRIDASGRVTMPYQPAFNARGAVSQTYTTPGWKKISYPNSVSQRGSAYNSATSTFTAPVSAWYYFSITANFLSNSDVDGAIAISKNGSTTDAGITVMQSQNGGSYNGRSASGVVYLAVNDYVNAWAYSTVNITSRANTWAGHFSGYLIG